MKRIISSRSLPTLAAWAHRSARIYAISFAVASAYLMASSCIYDKPPGDEFYRTLWKSDEVPLGPFDASELTLEFLCGEKATITTVSASRQSSGPSAWGSYGHDGQTAVFSGLSLTYDSTGIRTGLEGLGIGEDTDGYTTITFLEAHRDGETLFLLWRVENMVYPFTTALHRLSAYEHTDE